VQELHIRRGTDTVQSQSAMAKLVVSTYFVFLAHKALNCKIDAVNCNIIIPLSTPFLLLINVDVNTKLCYGNIYLMAGPSKDINRMQRLHYPRPLATAVVSRTSMTKTLRFFRAGNKMFLSKLK
jgi:hypothetical protein